MHLDSEPFSNPDIELPFPVPLLYSVNFYYDTCYHLLSSVIWYSVFFNKLTEDETSL